MIAQYVTYCLLLVSGFCVFFFITCGMLILLDTARLRSVQADARKALHTTFFGTVLTGIASAGLYLFSPDALHSAIDDLQSAQHSGTLARANTAAAMKQLRAVLAKSQGAQKASIEADGKTPAVFIHKTKNVPQRQAEEMAKKLEAAGLIAPPVEAVDVATGGNQLRYYHKDAEEVARKIAQLVGLGQITFVDGFQEEVDFCHFEIWLAV